MAAWHSAAPRDAFAEKLRHLASFGVPVRLDAVDGDAARAAAPLLSKAVRAGVLVHDQEYAEPFDLCAALAASITRRGGTVVEGAAVRELSAVASTARIGITVGAAEDVAEFDHVVIATGAHLPALAGSYGVRALVQAGRGYSFTAGTATPSPTPIYLPGARLACTPTTGGLRIAGLMEFDRPEAPMRRRRIEAMARAARALLDVDVAHRKDEWVGSRPCTVDGLPLIGATRHPNVHVAGGHGMWGIGITLGPQTGRLLARQITGGTSLPELTACDPLR
ncbi:NAD(P)/FAD-dependent oxidoreductase [Thermocatellispora tengchongensis]|uniref:NAD(P)/FAD-dependent oxidoreductase n=1 Tax=Thermocatellispora tengchongensis TaxID=1073253 RepID=UPI0036353785